MSLVRDVLNRKGDRGHEVTTIESSAVTLEAAKQMRERHIGALVVMEGEKIVGIFSERDLMNRVVAAGKDPATTPVRDVMTAKVAFCTRDTTVESCRTAMSRNRMRHLPVVEGGKLVGIISSGDILSRELVDHEETIRYLHEYMHGPS